MADYLHSKIITQYPGLVCGSYQNFDAHGALMFGRKCKDEKVICNRKTYFKYFGINPDNVVFQQQTHSTNIKIITKEDRGKGVFEADSAIRNNDGMISSKKGVFLCLHTADCAPFFFYDPTNAAFGAAHAGWKGVLGELPRKMIIEACEKFKSDCSDIKCYLGPMIGKCCYDVSKAGDNRVVDFKNKFGHNVVINTGGKVFLDLEKSIIMQLLGEGILRENIERSSICTCCDKKYNLPSYYREGGKIKGSILSVIGINTQNHERFIEKI